MKRQKPFSITPDLVDASTVEPKPTLWLWPRRIPRSMLTLLAGPEKKGGKSLLTIHFTACVTTGRPWPGESHFMRHNPGHVIILSGEDPIEYQIIPRLHAAGADCSLVKILRGVIKHDQHGKPIEGLRFFDLDKHLPQLKQTLIQHPDTKLVIVDPLESFTGDRDINKQGIRVVLSRLARIAEDYRIALVYVVHFNKSQGVSITNRITGGRSIRAAARMIYYAMPDPDEHNHCFLVPGDNNITTDQPGLSYWKERIYGAGRVESARTRFDGKHTYKTGQELLSAFEQVGKPSKKLDEAREFLEKALSNGKVDMKIVIREATKVGISERNIQRARSTMPIKQTYEGRGKTRKSFWRL